MNAERKGKANKRRKRIEGKDIKEESNGEKKQERMKRQTELANECKIH